MNLENDDQDYSTFREKQRTEYSEE
jgi:hypothetical protein